MFTRWHFKGKESIWGAITAAGLHVLEGSEIWELYREFELAIFSRIDKINLTVRYFNLFYFIFFFGVK